MVIGMVPGSAFLIDAVLQRDMPRPFRRLGVCAHSRGDLPHGRKVSLHLFVERARDPCKLRGLDGAALIDQSDMNRNGGSAQGNLLGSSIRVKAHSQISVRIPAKARFGLSVRRS